MLSSALRMGHKPIKKKARQREAESKAQKQAQNQARAPMDAHEERTVNLKHAARGTAAVGAQLVALSEAASPLVTYFWGSTLSLNPGSLLSSWNFYLVPSVGLTLILLLTGWLFFKKQQRTPMLLNALAWIVMLQFFPHWMRPLWPAIVFAIVSLAAALTLGKRKSEEPKTPIK